MTRVAQIASALLFALVLAAPAAAQRDTETIDRTVPMPAGGTLRLKTFSARVKITGGSGDQVVVHAVPRATPERLAEIKLEITNTLHSDLKDYASFRPTIRLCKVPVNDKFQYEF